MSIDWFTVAAQIINFLVLVWLLKRFLYGPILRAISERQTHIDGQLAGAADKLAEAERQGASFRERIASFEREKASLLRDAENEASRRRGELLAEAQAEFQALRSRLDAAWTADHDDVRRQWTRHALEEVVAIARKALAELADTRLEDQVIVVFLKRLHQLGGEERRQLTAALTGSRPTTRVRSAFDLEPAQRSRIEEAIRELAGTGVPVRFETDPDLLGGIELLTDGYRVAWSIARYLDALEESLRDLPPANHATDTPAA